MTTGGALIDVTWDGTRFLVLKPTSVLASQNGLGWTSLGEHPAGTSFHFIASNGHQLVAGGGEYGYSDQARALSVRARMVRHGRL